jgi:tetratricopeptide (TPR) repeat protein
MRRSARFAALPLLLLAGCGNAPPLSHAIEDRHDALLEPGQALYWRSEYDSARAVWSAALDIARADGDSLGVAKLLTWLGLAAYRSRDFANARALGEAALELKLTLGDERELARSYNALGMLALDEARLLDGIHFFERARAAATAAGDDRAAGAAAGNLGLIQANLGDLEQAEASLRLMRDAARAAADPRLEANALTNLAMVAVWAGDPQAALLPLDSARAIYRAIDYPPGEQYALGQLATAYSAMGEYQQALTTLDTALILSRRHQLHDHEADNLRLLGGLLADLGDARRALRHLAEAADLARSLGMDAELGSVLRRAAVVNLSLGATQQALTDAHAALAAHRLSGDVFDEIDDLIVLADIQRVAGAGAAASASLRSARALAGRLGARRPVADVALAEARHHEHAGRSRDVLRSVARAETVMLAADFGARTEAGSLAARAYVALGLPDSAAVRGLAAVHALERVRTGLASTELRGTFAAASSNVYGGVVMTLLQLGRTAEAFAVADAARSRELLQQLTSARATAEPAAAAGTAGFAAAELLLRRIDALLDQLREMDLAPAGQRSDVESTTGDIMQRVTRLRDEYESLQVRSAGADPRSARILGVTRTEEAGVLAVLGADEVLLHYTMMDDRLVVFAARAGGLATVQVPVSGTDVASRVRLLRELWGTPDAPLQRGVGAGPGVC